LKTRPFLSCAALAALALAGCKDSNAPADPRGIRNVFVGVRVDPAALRERGEFVLALVPVDGNEQVVLSTTLQVTPKLTAPAEEDLPPIGALQVEEPDPRPVAAAISIDDSRSMRSNDPDNQRADAARLFWTEILAGNAQNQVSLLTFGGAEPSAPFARSTLQQDWTRDASLLEAALGRLLPANDTYLYESTKEIAEWVAATKPGGEFRRIMLLVTDGRPTGTASQEEAIDAAVVNAIPLYTVGIGPASDQSSRAQPEAVERLRTLANRTQGVYAGAESSGQLSTVFQSLARVTTEGALLVPVRLSAPPVTGTTVRGTVRVGNEYSAATADWSFVAQ
jgi:hypothetical protein